MQIMDPHAEPPDHAAGRGAATSFPELRGASGHLSSPSRSLTVCMPLSHAACRLVQGVNDFRLHHRFASSSVHSFASCLLD